MFRGQASWVLLCVGGAPFGCAAGQGGLAGASRGSGARSAPGTSTAADGTAGTRAATGSADATTGDGHSTAEGESEGASTSTANDTSESSGGAQGSSEATTDEPRMDVGAAPDVMNCPDNEGLFEHDFSYIWIANTDEGTVSKIDTRSGVELGRFLTAPTSGSPSRTSVNAYGDVAVADRHPGAVTKIAARETHCVDRNGDGTIQTSTGASDVLPWLEDECMLWHIERPTVKSYPHGVRPIAWEVGELDPGVCQQPKPRLWFAWKNDKHEFVYERVDGDTGQGLDVALGAVMWNNTLPYGGAANADGDFFVTSYGNATQHLSHVDAVTLDVTNLGNPNAGDFYGVALDGNGDPWMAGYNDGLLHHYDVAAGTWEVVDPWNGGGQGGKLRGVQVDSRGVVWAAVHPVVAGPCATGLAYYDTTTATAGATALPGCAVPVGVSIDADGFVWVVDQAASSAFKVDPFTRAITDTVSGLNVPYTYSDMTGAGLRLVWTGPQ